MFSPSILGRRGRFGLLLSLLLAVECPALTIGFEGPEYATNQTVVGVNDSAVCNAEKWQNPGQASTSAAMTASTARPSKGARALRLADGSTTTAYITRIDTAGEFSTTQPFTLSFSLAVSGTNAANGTLQAQIQFGRGVAEAWNDFKSWLHLDFNGNDVRLFVYDAVAADRKRAVVIGQHNSAYVRISATIDPVTKKYAAVSINGTDVTALVQAQNTGTIPWRADVAGDPNFMFWVTTGTDDVLTLDVDEIRMAQTWTAQANTEWQPYIQANTNVQIAAGSALDFSNLYPRPAIDTRGFAYVGRDGDLVFGDGTKARLLCAAETMDWLPFNYASDTEMDAYVAQLKRTGYNCFRPHFLDHFLMAGSSTDLVVNPARFTAWEKLVKKLKDGGIYLLMDATTSWSSFYSVSDGWSSAAKQKRLKTRMYWDQTARDHWFAAVSMLYTDVNAYTGTTLANDPQVIANCLRNEPGLVFQLQNDAETPALATEPGLLAEWRTWLSSVQTHYANIAALNTAWGTAYATFNDVPLPAPAPNATYPARFRDLQKFAVNIEQSTYAWMAQKFRGLGVKSVVMDYNADVGTPSSLTRDVLDATDIHTYHDHGYADPANGYYWRHSNISSADDSLAYIRLAAQTRHWGRPFTVSEWGHVYWNPWRHEGGLAFPGYAALQGWSLISQHGHSVTLTPKILDPFNIFEDPPRKAAERMAAMLYARGDVATSPNRVEAVVSPSDANHGNVIGIGWPLMPAGLLTRIGLRVAWPAIIRDAFDDAQVATLTERNDTSVPSNFWQPVASAGSSSSVTTASGTLSLRAADLGYPSASVWGGTSASDAFNFFNNQVVFSASGITFDPASTIPADKQVLRFSLTSNVSATNYGAADCVTLEIYASGKVVLGYKVDASGTNTLNVVESIAGAPGGFSTVEGFSLNPNAADLNELATGQPKEPTYDLTIYHRAANDQPAYKRYTGRWKKQTSFPALAVSSWGGAGNSYLQFEAQKANGVAGGWIKATVDEFRVQEAASGPVGKATLSPASYSQTVPADPSTLDFATVVQSLRSSGVLGVNNLTDAAVYGGKKGIYHSDTEQIYFKPEDKVIRIVTPRSEGATLPSTLSQVDLPHLQVVNQPAPDMSNSMSVLVSSLNTGGQSVQVSTRLLFILSSDALNDQQKFEDHHRLDQLTSPSGGFVERGYLPTLLKRSKVQVSLLNDNHATLNVYPLNPDGTRRAALTTTHAGGRVSFTVDTGTLAGGPAVYFEIATP